MEDDLARASVADDAALHELIAISREAGEGAPQAVVHVLGRIPRRSATRYLIDEVLGSAAPALRAAGAESLAQDEGWNMSVNRGARHEDRTLAVGGPIANGEIVAALLARLRVEESFPVVQALVGVLQRNLRGVVLIDPGDAADHPYGLPNGKEITGAFLEKLRTGPAGDCRDPVIIGLGVSHRPEAIEALLEVARFSPNPLERIAGLFSLMPHCRAEAHLVVVLLDAFCDADPLVRAHAAEAAAWAGGRSDEVLVALKRLRCDKNPRVQVRVVAGMVQNLTRKWSWEEEKATPRYDLALDVLESLADDELPLIVTLSMSGILRMLEDTEAAGERGGDRDLRKRVDALLQRLPAESRQEIRDRIR